jgi:hypothetical protein
MLSGQTSTSHSTYSILARLPRGMRNLFLQEICWLCLSFRGIVRKPSGDRGQRMKSWLNDKVIGLSVNFLLPQTNGYACVNFRCTHPTDCLFRSLQIYLLGFFSKYECSVTHLIMSLYHFIFLGCHLTFCITRFHIYLIYKGNNGGVCLLQGCLFCTTLSQFLW